MRHVKLYEDVSSGHQKVFQEVRLVCEEHGIKIKRTYDTDNAITLQIEEGSRLGNGATFRSDFFEDLDDVLGVYADWILNFSPHRELALCITFL